MQALKAFWNEESRSLADVMVVGAVALAFMIPMLAVVEHYPVETLLRAVSSVSTSPAALMIAAVSYVAVFAGWTWGSFLAADRFVRWTYRSGSAQQLPRAVG